MARKSRHDWFADIQLLQLRERRRERNRLTAMNALLGLLLEPQTNQHIVVADARDMDEICAMVPALREACTWHFPTPDLGGWPGHRADIIIQDDIVGPFEKGKPCEPSARSSESKRS